MELFETWGLTLIVFLPLAGAFLLGLLPEAEPPRLKTVALLASLAPSRCHSC